MKWFEIDSKALFDPIYNPTSRIDFNFVRRMRTQKKWDQRSLRRKMNGVIVGIEPNAL